jgi:hypothetical protein
VTVGEGKYEGKGGEQTCQERKKNSIKVWKRVTRSGEEESLTDDSHHTKLGKRKGELEDENNEA